MASTGNSAVHDAAVIDIGANSIRAVIYRVEDGRFFEVGSINEKPQLGRGVYETGRLSPRRIQKALKALELLDIAIDLNEATRRVAFATAGVRVADEASQRAFLERAQAVLDTPINVLSGAEEGWCAARGVIAGGLTADGLVADIGGLSLELASVKDGRPREGATYVVGPLAVDALLREGPEAVRAHVLSLFEEHAPPDGWTAHERIYGVGGAWRALANAHIARVTGAVRRGRPHGYEMPASDALKTIQTLIKNGPAAKTLLDKGRVSEERRQTLRGAILGLGALLEKTQAHTVVISAFGVREGMLAKALKLDARVRALSAS